MASAVTPPLPCWSPAVGVGSASVITWRALGRAQARGSATRLAAGIRYLYDQAIVTGKYYRLTVDLEGGTYKAERSDDRFYLTAEKENGPGRGKAFDADAESRRRDEEEARRKDETSSLANGTVALHAGGRYVHNTLRSVAGILPQLSTAPGTELGELEYDVPGTAPFALDVSGRTFGSHAFAIDLSILAPGLLLLGNLL